MNIKNPHDSSYIKLGVTDAAYPLLLKEISDYPKELYVRGNVNVLSDLQIAIVGSRNPSPLGEEHAFQFAYQLSKVGLTITSGLALGIDAAAHRGALKAKGKTIAVLGSGIENTYPRAHVSLADEIVASEGAVVSEYPEKISAHPLNFPKRNRIISGLSLGTLIIEAAPRSGSLITARLAAQQGREVFAVPGSIRNLLSRGCHQLIRQGAKLVETIEDILVEIKQLAHVAVKINHLDHNLSKFDTMLDEKQNNLLHWIGFEPISIDEVVALSNLPVQEVTRGLLNLQMRQYVTQTASGLYIRVKT